jgi:glutamyl-tRNA reductase
VLALVGMNHRSAPLPVRERAAFPDADLPAALRRLVGRDGTHEACIVSTCNRVEVLARVTDGKEGAARIKRFLGEERGFTPEEIDRYTYQLHGSDAARHLFEVASGLDSMVLGEPQILGQVKRAYVLAREAGATGSVLEHLLQQCLAAAKRVRTETGISRHAVSIAFAAVELARQIFGDLAGRTCLLLGAGKMTELAARHLTQNGVSRVVVSNRTFDRAVRLAERFDGVAVNWDEGFGWLERADIVVTGTAAAEPILDKSDVHKAMRARRNRPLFLIDIAVPRDVDPSVNELDNVYVYDIDDLQGVVDSNLEQRRRAAAEAARIVEKEVEAFDRWRNALEVTPTIVALRESMLETARRELERFRRRLGPLSAEQEKAIEEMSRGVIQKILHRPTVHLKSLSDRGEAADCAALYREIFGLSPSQPEQNAPAPAEPPTPERSLGPHRILRGGKES